MRKFLLSIIFLLPFLVSGQNGGACVFILPEDSTIVCYTTGNAGNPSINGCLNSATDLGAIQIDCLTFPFVNCASWYVTNGVGCFFGGTGNCGSGDVCDLVLLPVELVSFSGVNIGDKNIVTWTTSSENNSAYFSLRVFGSASSSYEIYNLPAAGFSQGILNYRFVHSYPILQQNYYQLVQYDMNGDFKEYEIITIDNRVLDRVVVKRMNLLGQAVDEHETGFIIFVFSDGTIEKRFINN